MSITQKNGLNSVRLYRFYCFMIKMFTMRKTLILHSCPGLLGFSRAFTLTWVIFCSRRFNWTFIGFYIPANVCSVSAGLLRLPESHFGPGDLIGHLQDALCSCESHIPPFSQLNPTHAVFAWMKRYNISLIALIGSWTKSLFKDSTYPKGYTWRWYNVSRPAHCK